MLPKPLMRVGEYPSLTEGNIDMIVSAVLHCYSAERHL